jgi:replicative DNA helicase
MQNNNTNQNLKRQNKGERNYSPKIDWSNLTFGKVPPQAREIEGAVLGAIMIEKGAFDLVSEILKPESFYVDAHQRIFKACTSLSIRNNTIDVLTVVEELKTTEELEIVGGPYFVTKLTNDVMSSANIEIHSRIIQEKFLQRELIRISGETITEAFENSADAFDLIDKHETKLLTLTASLTKGDVQDSETLAVKAMEKIDYLMEHKEDLSGVTTGYPLLNRLTNGWQDTDLIIIAARPSVGKTAFALNLAINAATNKSAVGFFSLEMNAGQLVNRILSTVSRVPLEKIVRGRLNEQEYEKVFQANVAFGQMDFYIDDTAGLNVMEFRSKARKLVSKKGVKLIVIDYLQLMSGMGNGNREQEISTISRNIKVLAKDLKIPIIALSQMSRDIEKRSGEPRLSDLRESGAIEQDADMVMFLYRPDYQQTDAEIDPSLKGDAFVKIAKHRNGGLEKLPFKTDLSIQTWFEPDQFSSYESKASFASWKRIEENPF